ncbi:hypothetical protein P154DRAFT_622287 [Amniculicola lignicola CBS 123094]|uniref:Uncharacterized protein n=1 Tax=Amniculicola lignicola CBS 123094 TaxID=1392246 RepID=A0A6A5W7K8_9PLEO|nr:hypothetical protein P154DRAFT_622287 [Amniculicola lignicola CBS 123094]
MCERGTPLVAANGDIFYFISHYTYKYSVYVFWDHWRFPKTDADLPSAFSILPIDIPPPSLRNGGYIEDHKSRDCRGLAEGARSPDSRTGLLCPL